MKDKPAHPVIIALFLSGIICLVMYLFMRWEFMNNTGIIKVEQSDELHRVYVKADRNHAFIARGVINDVAIDFTIDTGASRVTIPESMAKKAGLTKLGGYQVQTVNGVINAHETIIPGLSIGSIILIDVPAFIVPDADKTPLLGMSALKELLFTHHNGLLVLAYPKAH